VITFGLSTDRLITQLLITTSTDPSPDGLHTLAGRVVQHPSSGLPDEVVEKSLDASPDLVADLFRGPKSDLLGEGLRYARPYDR
jgi:hypothetical protein